MRQRFEPGRYGSFRDFHAYFAADSFGRRETVPGSSISRTTRYSLGSGATLRTCRSIFFRGQARCRMQQKSFSPAFSLGHDEVMPARTGCRSTWDSSRPTELFSVSRGPWVLDGNASFPTYARVSKSVGVAPAVLDREARGRWPTARRGCSWRYVSPVDFDGHCAWTRGCICTESLDARTKTGVRRRVCRRIGRATVISRRSWPPPADWSGRCSMERR